MRGQLSPVALSFHHMDPQDHLRLPGPVAGPLLNEPPHIPKQDALEMHRLLFSYSLTVLKSA